MLKSGSIIALALLAQLSSAEMIIFENTNPSLNMLSLYHPNQGEPIFGQSLNITQDAFSQPAIGETPSGSVFFMQTRGFIGDFIWMGTGSLTNTARSLDSTLIPDPFAGFDVPYFGPEQFTDSDPIDASANFVEGWRALHGVNDITDAYGLFVVEEFFNVGIEFQIDNQTHYGFAEFQRTIDLNDNQLKIEFIPTRWGYQDTPGAHASIVPAPSTLLSLSICGFGACSSFSRRRR